MTDWLDEVQETIDGNLAKDPHYYDDPNAPIKAAVAEAMRAGPVSSSSNTRFAYDDLPVIFDGGYTGSGFYGPDNDTYQEWVRKGRP